MFSLQTNLFPSPMLTPQSSTKTLPTTTTVTATVTKRRAIVFNSSLVVASWLNLHNLTSSHSQQLQDELQQQEDHLVQLFQVFFSNFRLLLLIYRWVVVKLEINFHFFMYNQSHLAIGFRVSE